MQEKIPQDVLDKMSCIASRMQGYVQDYKENVSYDEVIMVSLSQLSSEIIKLARFADIQEIQNIDSNSSVEDCVKHTLVICNQIENIRFLNDLKDTSSIVFNDQWKDQIRTYVVTIKSLLDGANIENERLRNSIFSKLNAFSTELDKTKTSIQSFQDAFLDMTLVVGQGTENMKHAIEVGLKVMRCFGKAINFFEHPQLPPPDDHKLLSPPDDTEEDE